MPSDARPSPLGLRLIAGGLLLSVVLIGGLEVLSRRTAGADRESAPLAEGGGALRPIVASYEGARAWVRVHPVAVGASAAFFVGALLIGLRSLARRVDRLRERVAGMRLRTPSYSLPHPLQDAPSGVVSATRAAWARAVTENREADRVVLGLDERAAPVYLSDRARSMHVHLLGQTGSGKTQSVIAPLLYQDALRGRPIVFLDAKGAIENEEMLSEIAAAAGREEELRLFSLNPGRPTQTYNPLHLCPSADPRAMAERVFSTFADDMDNPYYRDMAREMFVHVVEAFAATGRAMCMWDLIAALSDEHLLMHALSLSSDRRAVRAIEKRVARLGDRYDQTYSGLLAALSRYDHPALNRYDPDVVLEDLLEGRGIVGFSLSANAYRFLSRAVGVVVLQHLQQLGAARQQDRTLPQTPLYVYADEFASFAYEGFVDALNKLRDANISILLSHQSLSDLERVSKEYARAVWDNTRNKIVLYQNDVELCERLAGSLGTKKQIELTVRRNTDGWLNQRSMLEASSREVDGYVLHPSRLKNLRVGQAYLVQAGVGDEAEPRRVRRWSFVVGRWFRRRPGEVPAARAVGVSLPMMGALPPAAFPERKTPDESHGLHLYDLGDDERGSGGAVSSQLSALSGRRGR